jgi:hypothetical protein
VIRHVRAATEPQSCLSSRHQTVACQTAAAQDRARQEPGEILQEEGAGGLSLQAASASLITFGHPCRGDLPDAGM